MYVFSGRLQPLGRPGCSSPVPHDGTISISLGFWGDGTLFATTVSMDES